MAAAPDMPTTQSNAEALADERRPRRESESRSRARAALRARGYRLIDDVPVHPDTVERLIELGLMTRDVAESDAKLAIALFGLIELFATIEHLSDED